MPMLEVIFIRDTVQFGEDTNALSIDNSTTSNDDDVLTKSSSQHHHQTISITDSSSNQAIVAATIESSSFLPVPTLSIVFPHNHHNQCLHQHHPAGEEAVTTSSDVSCSGYRRKDQVARKNPVGLPLLRSRTGTPFPKRFIITPPALLPACPFVPV